MLQLSENSPVFSCCLAVVPSGGALLVSRTPLTCYLPVYGERDNDLHLDCLRFHNTTPGLLPAAPFNLHFITLCKLWLNLVSYLFILLWLS